MLVFISSNETLPPFWQAPAGQVIEFIKLGATMEIHITLHMSFIIYIFWSNPNKVRVDKNLIYWFLVSNLYIT